MRAQLASFCLAIAFPIQSFAMSCNISSMPIGDLGVYTPEIDVTRQYAIFLNCTGGGGMASITAGPSHTTGSIENRRIKHSNQTSTLRYQLCLDGNCSKIFGNSGNQIGSVVIDDRNQGRFSFFARIYGGEFQAAAGLYRDSVTITITP
ncbi:spore coat U domain-containing protein [Chitinibacter sp. SCUT-21]|uniref:spore coat protein U domain-containing protein n=1 Tax=Chitinibacter sp. SCUT-21 TaxID=2970891 RepID=UPI0035A67CB7